MKSTIIAALILAVFLLSAITSKPDDQELIDRCLTHEVGHYNPIRDLVDITGVGQAAYRIEDNILSKSVYNRITGQHVATSFFTHIFFVK